MTSAPKQAMEKRRREQEEGESDENELKAKKESPSLPPPPPRISEDLLPDILPRLPVKSLMRFKAVHSSWLSLISSPQLALDHLSRSNSLSLLKYGVIQLENTHSKNPDLCLRTLIGGIEDPDDFDSVEIEAVKLQNPFGFKVNYNTNTDIQVLGSCHGLLLISLGNIRDFILWNPSTRQYKNICRCFILFSDYGIVGLGYDSYNDNYKVVVAGWELSQPTQPRILAVAVYNLKTNYWEKKKIQFPYLLYFHSFVKIIPGNTLPNGIPHWLVKTKLENTVRFVDVLLYFNLSEEKFMEIPLPYNPGSNPYLTFLSSFNGLLCVGLNDYHGPLNLWVMRENGNSKSWDKLCFPKEAVPPAIAFLEPLMPLGFVNKDQVVNRDQVVMNLNFNAIAIYYRSRNKCDSVLLSGYLRRNEKMSRVVAYVESLVWPNN